ncbi:MAG: hypothetical protein WAK17_23310 [Candidatus Nitrosopolaris sp.]
MFSSFSSQQQRQKILESKNTRKEKIRKAFKFILGHADTVFIRNEEVIYESNSHNNSQFRQQE